MKTFDERRILTLQVPDEGGWAYFRLDEDTMKLVFRVEDKRKRLGKLRLMSFDEGLMVGELSADPSGSRIAGSLRYYWDQQYYLAYLFSKRGEVLAKLLIDRGWWDAVVPVIISREFLPYRPAPPSNEQIRQLAGRDNFPGEDGEWGQVNPPPPFGNYPVGEPAYTIVVQEFSNERDRPTRVSPTPHAWIRKRWILLDTYSLLQPKVREPWLKQAVHSPLEDMKRAAQSNELALDPVTVPPYAQGLAYWRVSLRGLANAALWLPKERKRWGQGINALLDGIQQQLAVERDLLAEAAARIANRLLRDPSLQRSTGLKPGDVLPGGNLYTVQADAYAGYRAENLKQTVRLRAYAQYRDGSREPVDATVVVFRQRAMTEPAPPSDAEPGEYRVGKDGIDVALGKGWVYELWIDGHPEHKTTIQVPIETSEIRVVQYRSAKPSAHSSTR